MKIGIVAAMQEELESFLKAMPGHEETDHGRFNYYTGKIYGTDIVLLLCGIGKVNAAVGTTLLIEKFKPDYIINSGVGGGFANGTLKIGDIIISSEVRHHDVDATAFDYEHGQVPGMPAAFYPDEELKELACAIIPDDDNIKIYEGQILSADMFVHRDEQVHTIRERFQSVMAAEMEGAAIAQTCCLFNIPFLIIRSISDIVDDAESHNTYNQTMQKTADNSVSFVLKLLQESKEKLHGKNRKFQC